MSFGFGLPFLPFFIQELGMTDPVQLNIYTGVVNAAPAVAMAVMAPLWGMAGDRWGRKLMILRAMLAASFIIAAMGMSTHVWHLVALRMAQGAFTGTITATNAFVASETPKEKMAFALGFLSSSNFVGYSLGPVLGGLLAEAMGFRVSFFVGATMMLCGFFLVKLALVEDPATYGVAMKSGKGIHRGPLLTPLVLNLLLMLFLMRVVRSTFSPYLPLYIQGELPFGSGAAAVTGYISGAAGLATALSGLTLSRLGDKYNKKRLMGVMGLCGIVVAISICFAGNLWLFAGLYSLLYFVLGGIEPIVMSITAESTPQEKRGAMFGIQGTVSSLGWIASPMIGATIAIHWSNHAILWTLPVQLLLLLAATRGLNRGEPESSSRMEA